jgi:Animal haem peroxidase
MTMADVDQEGTHRVSTRGQFRHHVLPSVAESSLKVGRFGRMFRNLPSNVPEPQWLVELAGTMVEGAETGDAEDLPAGITYFGQFIDHDLTFDPVSSLDRQNDPDALVNFRTPRFDLDSVYGRGPDDQPHLYRSDDLAKLLLGVGEQIQGPDGQPHLALNDPVSGPRREDDLPRNTDGKALIGDPRNDENIIVGQLQLAFLKLHNRLVDDLRGNGSLDLGAHRWSGGTVFQEAQRLARWHYQWLVLKFFLPAVCEHEILQGLLEESGIGGGRTCRRVRSLRYYLPQTNPYIPVEWSVAAYRFGHSLIRPSYHLNATLRELRPGNAPIDIFVEDPTPQNRLQHLAGGRQLPPFWTIDWRMFFRFAQDDADLQLARRIDTKLAGGLRFLPGLPDASRMLALRNLQRGAAMGLPSGQAVARRLCVRPLSTSQLGLDREAPLWFYVLREAEVEGEGQNLGPVGSTIVAEAMLGMLAADPFSFLRTDPTWEPVLPLRAGGQPRDWSMADLLAYAVPADGRHLQPPPQPPPPPPDVPSW